MPDNKQLPCVLIVDDDYYFSTDVLGYHLKKKGYRVIQAYTAFDFEQMWKDADVIVLDIRLPKREGEPIDPWAGIHSLDNILKENSDNLNKYPQLKNCIIRSAQTKADAVGASIKIPVHYIWYSPDIPFSEIIKTIKEVADKNSKRGN